MKASQKKALDDLYARFVEQGDLSLTPGESQTFSVFVPEKETYSFNNLFGEHAQTHPRLRRKFSRALRKDLGKKYSVKVCIYHRYTDNDGMTVDLFIKRRRR